MGHIPLAHAMTRRGFLRNLTAVTGAVALAGARPGVAAALTLPTARRIRRVGLLLTEAPGAPGQRIEAGMRLALDQAGVEARFDLVTAETDGGATEMIAGATSLLEGHKADLLIAMAGPQLIDTLAPLLESTGAELLALETGANAVRSLEQHPSVTYHTLGYWQAAWALGGWAARTLGKQAFIAGSFLESGYDAIDAYQIGFEAAGGTVVESQITHVPGRPFTWANLMSAIRKAAPDVVFAQYGGQLAVDFVKAFSASGLGADVSLLGSPWLVDESLLPLMGATALGIRSVHSWAPELPVAENAAFAAAYRQRTGQEPNGFAVLGYDTARLLLGQQRGDRIASPRGWVRIDAGGQSVAVPLYLREVRMRAGGPANAVIEPLGIPAADDPRLAPLRTATRTGWLPAHLGC